MEAKPETQLEAYRRMTPAVPVAAGCALHDFAYDRLVLYLSRKHPDRPPTEIRRLAARRLLHDAAEVL